jgi:hypothetical protein
MSTKGSTRNPYLLFNVVPNLPATGNVRQDYVFLTGGEYCSSSLTLENDLHINVPDGFKPTDPGQRQNVAPILQLTNL